MDSGKGLSLQTLLRLLPLSAASLHNQFCRRGSLGTRGFLFEPHDAFANRFDLVMVRRARLSQQSKQETNQENHNAYTRDDKLRDGANRHDRLAAGFAF